MKLARSRQTQPLISLFVFLLAAIITVLLAYNNSRDPVTSGQVDSPSRDVMISPGGTQPAAPAGVEAITGEGGTASSPEMLPTPDPWTGTRRVTILMLGLDYRDWEDNQGPPRTDTMMLLTIDPITLTAGILSIPRDLYVEVPGYGWNKINVAYRLGELYDLQGGGSGLAVRTVETLLGVDIDFYAQIDFFAFDQFINELGGVEVDVPYEITVDPIGPGNTLVLSPGYQILDGPTALAYARNRKTNGGDFDRARRQQQVILAIRNRVLSLNALPGLILRTPQLYASLGMGVHTDMNLDQIVQLAWLAQQIPAENIRRGVIGPNQAVEERSPKDEAILEPIPGAIDRLVAEVFNTTPGSIQAEGQELKSAALAEATSIRLVDASGIDDLGQATVAFLRRLGLTVTFRRADESVSSTRIIDHYGNPYTVQYLLEVMQLDRSHVDSLLDPGSTAGVEIVLGSDWARENPLPK